MAPDDAVAEMVGVNDKGGQLWCSAVYVSAEPHALLRKNSHEPNYS